MWTAMNFPLRMQTSKLQKLTESYGVAQTPRNRFSRVICMAHPRRIARVAKQIEREVGSLLIYDKVLQQAICPERKRGLDGALSALASVTDVQVSNDLQVAKVFLSIYSDEAGKEAAYSGLQRLEGYVRKHIGRTVRLRLTPEIRFIMDESIERTERMFKLLEQVKAIEAGEAPPPPITIFEEEYEEADDDIDDDIAANTVDLGFFEDQEDEYIEDGVDIDDDDESQQQGGTIQVSSGDDVGLSDKEVEEMMSLFRQESMARNKSGGGGGGGGGGKGRRRR